MTTKRVNRYYCDFCRKGGCSAGHMARHEKRCTLNPNRECGVCKLFEREHPLVAAMVATIRFLPAKSSDVFPQVDIRELRTVSNNCPACILAAMRQAPQLKDTHYGVEFDFKGEMAAAMEQHNESKLEYQEC